MWPGQFTDYVTVGNWRTYTLGDIVNEYLYGMDLEQTYIMNITDVGHLTGITKAMLILV